MKQNEVVLSETENKMFCALFNSVYRDELPLSVIVNSTIERYNSEEDETRKEMFKECIGNLCYWSLFKPSIAELSNVLVKLYNRLQWM